MIEQYDKSKIGECISWGSDHTVYEYGEHDVIKFSLIDVLLGSSDKSAADYLICQKYFPKYILPTRTVVSPNGKWVATIQEKMNGRYLCRSDFFNPFIQQQFTDILASYDQLLADGYSQIDLIGSGGVFKNCLSNIFISDRGQLAIIDSSLLEVKGHRLNPITYFFKCIVGPIAKWRQKNVLALFRMAL